MTDVDAARLPLMLATLHLPSIGRHPLCQGSCPALELVSNFQAGGIGR